MSTLQSTSVQIKSAQCKSQGCSQWATTGVSAGEIQSGVEKGVEEEAWNIKRTILCQPKDIFPVSPFIRRSITDFLMKTYFWESLFSLKTKMVFRVAGMANEGRKTRVKWRRRFRFLSLMHYLAVTWSVRFTPQWGMEAKPHRGRALWLFSMFIDSPSTWQSTLWSFDWRVPLNPFISR